MRPNRRFRNKNTDSTGCSGRNSGGVRRRRGHTRSSAHQWRSAHCERKIGTLRGGGPRASLSRASIASSGGTLTVAEKSGAARARAGKLGLADGAAGMLGALVGASALQQGARSRRGSRAGFFSLWQQQHFSRSAACPQCNMTAPSAARGSTRRSARSSAVKRVTFGPEYASLDDGCQAAVKNGT